MGMRAAQIHKAGAPGNKDPKTEADDEGRDRIGGRFFHVRSNNKTGIDRPYDCYGVKTFGSARAIAPGGGDFVSVWQGSSRPASWPDRAHEKGRARCRLERGQRMRLIRLLLMRYRLRPSAGGLPATLARTLARRHKPAGFLSSQERSFACLIVFF